MRRVLRLNRLALGIAVGSALFASIAVAADFSAEPASPAAMPLPIGSSSFDWGGHYAGALVGHDRSCLCVVDGVQVGYNAVWGNLLLGIEFETLHSVIAPFTIVDASAGARFGVILGGRALVYGQTGIGGWQAGIPAWTAGAGVELAIGETISVFAEGRAVFALPAIFVGTQYVGGVNVHVGDAAQSRAAGGADKWSGFYLGALAGWSAVVGGPEIGVQFGYNVGIGGRLVGGIEVETLNAVAPGAAVMSASLNARLGATFGDRVLAYGEIGLGESLFAGVLTAGSGVELAVGDLVSVFGEAKAGVFIGGGFAGVQLRGGVNWHLDY